MEAYPGQKRGGGRGERERNGREGENGWWWKERAGGNAGGCPKALPDASECLCGVPGQHAGLLSDIGTL